MHPTHRNRHAACQEPEGGGGGLTCRRGSKHHTEIRRSREPGENVRLDPTCDDDAITETDAIGGQPKRPHLLALSKDDQPNPDTRARSGRDTGQDGLQPLFGCEKAQMHEHDIVRRELQSVAGPPPIDRRGIGDRKVDPSDRDPRLFCSNQIHGPP